MKNILNVDKSTYNSTALKDMFGAKIQLGDVLARAGMGKEVGVIETVRVTRIEDGRVFVNNYQKPIMYPGRCINMNADFREAI